MASFPDCETVYYWLNQNHRIYHNLSPEEALAVFRNDIGARNDCLIRVDCTLFYENDIYICNFSNVANGFTQYVRGFSEEERNSITMNTPMTVDIHLAVLASTRRYSDLHFV